MNININIGRSGSYTGEPIAPPASNSTSNNLDSNAAHCRPRRACTQGAPENNQPIIAQDKPGIPLPAETTDPVSNTSVPSDAASNSPIAGENKPNKSEEKLKAECKKPVEGGTSEVVDPKGNTVQDPSANQANPSFEDKVVSMLTNFMQMVSEMIKTFMSEVKNMISGIVPKPGAPNDSVAQQPANSQGQTKQPDILPPRKMESLEERAPKLLAQHYSIGYVNEADLQTALIAYGLYQKSENIESYFLNKVDQFTKSGMTKYEANRAALKAAENDQHLSKTEANHVYSVSHRASQLDDKIEEVSVREHGVGTMNVNNAIQNAGVTTAGIITGHLNLTQRNLFE